MRALESFVVDVSLGARELEAKHFRRWALERLHALLPFDSAMFISSRLGNAPASVNKTGFDALYWRFSRFPDFYRRGMENGIAASRRDGAYLDTEVFSRRQRERLPLYAEMLRPQGITSQLISHLEFRGRPAGIVYLCRHGRVGNFRVADRERLARVAPTLTLAQIAVDPPNALAAAARCDLSGLSPREREVAELATRGLRNPEIARVLGVRPATVRNQMHAIFAKLAVTTRGELVARVLTPES